MKERPILFSGPMVRALLAGRKTQTRRAVKGIEIAGPDALGTHDVKRAGKWVGAFKAGEPNQSVQRVCPYGRPGDLLWVRETWVRQAQIEGAAQRAVIYRADDEPTPTLLDAHGNAVLTTSGRLASPWIPSIHMPRWASRITLEVTAVRVERLQAITEADAIAEGCESIPGVRWHTFEEAEAGAPMRDHTARDAYWALWEEINGEDSWKANPWVWAITFRRIG